MEKTIKAVAKEYHISKDTLRYYEKLKIISPKRYENGYRMYNQEDQQIVKYVQVMKYAQFSLEEIQLIMSFMNREPSKQCLEDMTNIFTIRKDKLKDAIINYKKIVTLLDTLLNMVEELEVPHENRDQINEFVNQLFNSVYNKEEQTNG